MDAASLKALATKLRRKADKDRLMNPASFSRDLDRAMVISDPLQRQQHLYMATIVYALNLATELAGSGHANELRKKLQSDMEEYMPGYPPISPVTESFFYSGLHLSHRFGADHETAVEIIHQVLQQWKVDSRSLDMLKRLRSSRSGIFETLEVSNAGVRVRELVTSREFRLIPSAGYAGQPGELRFSRVAIPAEDAGETFFEMTTPYILVGCDATEWTDYLSSEMPPNASRRDPLCGMEHASEVLPHSDLADRLSALFEDDCGEMSWNDYIMDGYLNYQKSAIFLTGIPSRPETLPHHDAFRNDGDDDNDDSDSGWKLKKSTCREHFEISPDLFNDDGEFDEDELNEYFDSLEDLFEESPECEALAEQETSYLSLLFSFGRDYFSAIPPALSAGELEEILFDLIPRKVTMDAGEAEPLVLEFQAFFRFLHRQFSVLGTAQLADICDQSAVKTLKAKLSDSSNFGLAKSFFSAGKALGFDMTSEEDIAAFAMAYNEGLASERDDFDDQTPVLVRETPAIGRNEPCPCGSGKKFKKCCLKG